MILEEVYHEKHRYDHFFDTDGFPIQKSGVSEVPGLYFVGLPWLSGQKSGLLLGVAENAEHIVTTIAAA